MDEYLRALTPQVDFDVGGGAGALRDALGGTGQPLVDINPGVRVEGAQRADHLHGVGNDVATKAAVNRAHGDDGGSSIAYRKS